VDRWKKAVVVNLAEAEWQLRTVRGWEPRESVPKEEHMCERGMHRRLSWLLVSALVLGLAVSGVAAAEDQDSVALAGGSPVSGVLTGNRAGAFAYFTVDYPGNRDVVRVELTFVPGDPVTSRGVGFNVYGPAGYEIGQGKRNAAGDAGVLELLYSDDNQATWLVQVYNYIPDRTIAYTIVVEGLPEQPSAPTTTPVTTAPTDGTGVVTGLEEPGSGSLTGSRAGAYAVYDLGYAGDGSEVTVMMSFTPDNPAMVGGVGFVIYGPSGMVAEGKRTGRPTERKATFSSDEPGAYIVQVHNYVDGITIHYAISAES
jgi:hypothetical protein